MRNTATFVSGNDQLPGFFSRAESVPLVLPSGRTAVVARATVQFANWSGPITIDTWGNKPVLDVNGEQTFAEVAILRAFQRAGWSARWLEAYNAAKGWPIVLDRWHPNGIRSCEVVDLGSYEIAQLLRAIIEANGGSCRGCWDVMAWKGDRVVLAESKRRSKDRINDNQRGFVEAALSVGVPADAFLIVEWTCVASRSGIPREDPESWPSTQSAPRIEPPKPAIMTTSNENNAGPDSQSGSQGVQMFKTHVEWRAWYISHPSGYFFNERRNVIHRVGCPHYKINDDVEEYFKSPKPCHASRSVLSMWVLETRGAPAKRCSSCP